ncbi:MULTISPECIES: DUF6326 family protein [unclassified Chryseobacterium]|uniref:DUF6326 family protein n=1 Tax=unclassified Chryseobacterium TaxID=2593645 RepID=UPI00100B1742|nr:MULTISPECIES: DUF6326 family protein [unclassified Chryseobacterium]RXM53758.1 hypothetical protein BOQ64_05335 [Chryseobacterium sp. CH25]RXM63354.1 hypothetical protein BOQ60_15345 [Chryseobacterium sp. CH1]
MNNSTQLEDIRVNVKIILAGLWTSVTLCYLYGDYFELYTPGKAQGLVDGHNLLNSPLNLLMAAVVLAIPAVMVFLSLILKPVINRILNIIVGIFFTLVMLFIGISSFSEWYLFYVFLAAVECIITILIVVYAWKWKRI